MKQALTDALSERGYETLTPVQTAVTDPELGNSDLLVSAQTGSGKTVGFGLALGPTLLEDDESFGPAGKPLALVIAPTRELAMQVMRELTWLYGKANAVVTSCVGGMDMRDERRALGRGAHVVVATPGRLRDHIMRGSIDLSGLRAVVLDEADEMLDLGFREDLEFILEASPKSRRTLLFSATVSGSIAKLAKTYQNDAVRVSTIGERQQHSDIEYHLMSVANRDDEKAIINVLRYYESPGALVFCNTRATVNRLTTRLSNRGFSVVSLSGELSQNERTHALQAMRDGRARVCVATDVAARGIDLPNLDLVIHADLPSNSETLLHRSGRTGRAGRKGVSILIANPKALRKAARLLSTAKLTAEQGPAPSAEAVSAQDEARMLADEAWHTPVAEKESEGVAKLLELHSPEQIAAAYLRLYRSRQTAPEELGEPQPFDPRDAKAAFGPSVWFSVAGGQNAGVEVRRFLPKLCKVGGITKDDIGAIRVQHGETLVEIRKGSVDGFLKSVGPKMEFDRESPITQIDAPSAAQRGPKPKFKPKASTAPVDWNDDPAPRRKKPKAPTTKDKGKPKFKKRARPEDSRPEGVVTPLKKKGGKNLAPAVGKANSKKNKARRAASKNPSN
ncbi:DEAD/DEAH box helicase [Neptunicoccus cionae]|uniref:DEAD/DEAH box helicase n=1 Tax=Neptunicoccus cionae TaxID=2035344 RepID=A0A916QWI7_9RHOB|nr:DEAD/DEAH box helicase [Amylibacter cionae]GGA15969.1 DEAD/DEAH box helicase [Amylibacter cionae]